MLCTVIWALVHSWVCVWDWEFFSPAVGAADEHDHYLARKAANMCFIPMLYIYQCDSTQLAARTERLLYKHRTIQTADMYQSYVSLYTVAVIQIYLSAAGWILMYYTFDMTVRMSLV